MVSKDRSHIHGWVHRGPLDLLEHEHFAQAQLCDSLERIADDLPDSVDRRLCMAVIETLKVDMPLHHRNEERGLFPLIHKRALPQENIHPVLERLVFEHTADESFANELIENLEVLSMGETLTNPDMFGYMLRGFFESYRRHIHWENAFILPMARARLNNEDLKELAQFLGSNTP